MTPQEMKESILWNAIQGKYTSQKEDESVNDVIGDTSLTNTLDEDAYFEIPANWRWARIGDIFDLVNGKAFKPTDWSEQGVPIVRIQNLNDPNAPYNCFSGEIEEKYMLNGGELLFSWSGTPGTSFGAFIWGGGKAVLNQHIFIVYPKIRLDLNYTKYALNAELRIFIAKAHGGAGLKHITRKEFDSCYLPIPPFAEQKRIVTKIEELLPYIDRYEKAWSRLEDFNKRFPTDMQKSILQLAIQGKLVPQRPEEGTGEALYQQIQNEKQSLIRSGKLKKEKPLPEISEEDMPLDIPDSWRWVRMADVITSTDAGKSPQCQSRPAINDEWGVIKTTAIQSGWFSAAENKVLPEKFEIKENQIIHKGDLLITRAGPRNRTGIICVVEDEPGKLILSDKTIRFNYLKGFVDVKYLMFALTSPAVQYDIEGYMTGMAASQVNISQDSMRKFLIPLPPLAEQKRIVAKLEELLPLCKRLKLSINI